MTGTCEVCGTELPNPFEDGAYLTVETVDICVQVWHPDRPHNNEVVDEADVCGEECADEYITEQQSQLSRCYTREVDFRPQDTATDPSGGEGQ